MSSSPITSALQAHHVLNLIAILRRANEHYRRVANTIRSSLRPTGHARKHAEGLGLAVDIEKAINCSQRQVSVIPLPILDTTQSPTTVLSLRSVPDATNEQKTASPLRRRPALKCAIPTARKASTSASLDVPTSGSAVLSPTSEASATSTVRGRHIPWRGLTSRFSVTPVDGLPEIRIPSLESEDTELEILQRSDDQWKLPEVPVDETDLDWGLEDSDMDISPVSSGSSSGSGSTSGPATPGDLAPIMIRIKRKSCEVSLDDVEKRPRIERKDNASVMMQRRTAIYCASK